MNPDMALLQRTLEEEIPLTRHIGIRVTDYDGESLRLGAPLAPNTNHKATVFGGSLYAVAVACGWGLLYLKLRDLGLHGHIVIHRAQIEYHHPVNTDFVAVARLPDPATVQRLARSLTRHHRGRLSLSVEVPTDEGVAVSMQGEYVVQA